MIAQKHCGTTAWRAFMPEYKDTQENTYTYDEDKGIYLSKMDRIQGLLPTFNHKHESDNDAEDSLSSMEENDPSFCVIEHLSVEMLNSYRICTATRIPGGQDSASSIGGLRPTNLSTCTTRAGGSYGESLIIDDQTDNSNEPESIKSYYSTSDLPGYPPIILFPWCNNSSLPQLIPSTSLLLQLAKKATNSWPSSFQQAYEAWSPKAHMAIPQSWTLKEKNNLLWYAYNFTQRNESPTTAQEFFNQGGKRWVDQVFTFWWKYYNSPEAPPLDQGSTQTMHLPPPLYLLC
jgi:hypothetical protein